MATAIMTGSVMISSGMADPPRKMYCPASRNAIVAPAHMRKPWITSRFMSSALLFQALRKHRQSAGRALLFAGGQIVEQESVDHGDDQRGHLLAASRRHASFVQTIGDQRLPTFDRAAEVLAISLRIANGQAVHFEKQPEVGLVRFIRCPMPESEESAIQLRLAVHLEKGELDAPQQDGQCGRNEDVA